MEIQHTSLSHPLELDDPVVEGRVADSVLVGEVGLAELLPVLDPCQIFVHLADLVFCRVLLPYHPPSSPPVSPDSAGGFPRNPAAYESTSETETRLGWKIWNYTINSKKTIQI